MIYLSADTTIFFFFIFFYFSLHDSLSLRSDVLISKLTSWIYAKWSSDALFIIQDIYFDRKIWKKIFVPYTSHTHYTCVVVSCSIIHFVFQAYSPFTLCIHLRIEWNAIAQKYISYSWPWAFFVFRSFAIFLFFVLCVSM